MDELREVQVTRSEKQKLTYLLGAWDAALKMQERYLLDKRKLHESDRRDLNRVIDWRGVASRCAPEILVVIANDGRRSEWFDDFPIYALIPRSGQFVVLDDEFSLIIEEDVPPTRAEVLGALHLLRSTTASIDESKQDNARKLLSGLHKLLVG